MFLTGHRMRWSDDTRLLGRKVGENAMNAYSFGLKKATALLSRLKNDSQQKGTSRG